MHKYNWSSNYLESVATSWFQYSDKQGCQLHGVFVINKHLRGLFINGPCDILWQLTQMNEFNLESLIIY